MPADELCSLNFPIAFIPYEMSKMIGNASPNGSIMIYGAPGGGKTSFVIQFAKLCAIADEDVLIISKEEGVNPTMKEKLIRFGANYPNIHIANDIPDNISSYHKVIFDSVQALQLEPSDLEKYIPFDTLKIYVFQSTKSGSYRGAREYEHIVDCVLKAEDGVVTSEGCKNRFGGRGSYKVY